MTDLKLFRLNPTGIQEIKPEVAGLEKSLQTLMESNLEVLLGVRFLASEYVTGKTHGGRIDTLGIDENGCPVIIEYKRSLNENVINQGLFYLDWLMDHRAEFELLVQKLKGVSVSQEIDWSAPRLLCIATDFTKYDSYAVQQINRNIELIRHRRFGTELLALELVNVVSAEKAKALKPPSTTHSTSVATVLISTQMSDLRDALREFLLSLGDDVQEKQLKLYVAYRRLKNFACVEIHKDRLRIHTKVDPDTVKLETGFTKDSRLVGHWGTGDLEISLRSLNDLERAKPLFVQAYEDN